MNEEEIIKKINKNKDKSIMFKVQNGFRKLNQFTLKNEKRIISLDNIPLVMLSEEKSPMNSSIIKLINGRSRVNDIIAERININAPIKNLEDGFDKLESFFELLDDGIYELKEEEMIPTDGEGNYFWNSAAVNKYYRATADVYYNGKYIKGFPKFLMPSQGIEGFDKDKVDYYREKIRNGEELFGVALELRGFISLLLDGHHKATAAYLEGKKLKCLTIGYRENKLKNVDLDTSKIRLYSSFVKSKKINIDNPKCVFPDFKAIAIVQSKVDVSREKIEKLFKFESNSTLEELEEIISYLTIYNAERAKELCFEILNKSDLQILWSECLNYLAKYREYDIACFFKEIKNSKKLRSSRNFEKSSGIINKYFNMYIN